VPVRWLRGSRRAGALPAAGLVVLVRSLRRSHRAGALPRLVLCLASERAWTGRLAAALVWGLGLRVSLRMNAGFGVRVLRVQRFCVSYGIPSPTQKRSASTRERSIVAAVCRGESHDSSFSWTGPREGRILPPLSPPSVDLQPQKRSCGCRSTDRTHQRRTVAQNAATKNPASPAGPDQTPRPHATPRPAAGRGPFGDHPRRRPRQRSGKNRLPATAHQHTQIPCGSGTGGLSRPAAGRRLGGRRPGRYRDRRR
jgi:hypothetical protein